MRKLFEKYPVGLVTGFALICLLPLLALRDFSPANELRYLSIADEALSGGHFFAFYNDGVPYADKPPLYFWFLMLCRKLLGFHSMPVISLFSFLCAAATVKVMDGWLLKGAGAVTRAAAAMLLLTSALFLGMSVYVRMDMLMCLFIVLALYSYRRERPWLFAVFTFLALFAKGPVGLLVPVLTVLCDKLLFNKGKGLGKWFGWRFWLILGSCCALWFGLAYLEGGKEYLQDLLFHQTVDRAVNAFHHKSPPWFYLLTIWGVAAPWCLLTVPSVIAGLRADGEECFLALVSTVTFVMLSMFSSKIALYLMPMLPFLCYGFVLCEKRLGWKGWMKAGLGVASAVFIAIGLVFIAGYFAFDRLPVPWEYGFLRSWVLVVCGVLAVFAGVISLVRMGRGWMPGVMVMGGVMLFVLLCLSPMIPQINERTCYGPLCREIIRAETAGGRTDRVYTIGLYRPENIDVYIGRRGVAVSKNDLSEGGLEAAGIPAGATVVVSKFADMASSNLYSSLLGSSGRRLAASTPLYDIWCSDPLATP